MNQEITNTAELPQFSKIEISGIEPKLTKLLLENLTQIDRLLTENTQPTWQNLMQPFEDLGDRLDRFWSPISHLNSVVNSKALREAYNACLPKLTEYGTKIGHNQKLYEAIQAIANSDKYHQLDQAQKKVIEHHLRDFKLAGVTLAPEKKERFRELCTELSLLTNKFEENVLDATMAWSKHVTTAELLAGLPAHSLQMFHAQAKAKGMDGWLLTLEMPCYIAVITYADSQTLRKEIYHAYTTRASDQNPNAGQWDNTEVMQKILMRRLELSRLLDFKNYAEHSLATKMVQSTQDVLDFLNELIVASLPKAKQEFVALTEFARNQLNLTTLNAWDVTYASEKLRQQRYAISQEDLRPYFPAPQVLTGLFTIVQKLYGITIKEESDIDVWHPDVRCFAIYHRDGSLQSRFYMDLYARKNKRGGAWMDECHVRRKLANGQIQIPVAYITCNFSSPVGDDPALLTHQEVVTLFHEFGHGLQHMLTQIDYADVSGINGIPWDAVEVASQFLENWAWEQDSIGFIAKHYQTGATLPQALFDKMLKAKNFQAALMMIRQLEFALFDFKLHLLFDPEQNQQIQAILNDVRQQVSVIPTPEFNRFQHSFSHIFAGGYAAGYYSYKWAEVMAADAFSLFIEHGIFDRETSDKFLHTILERGGAEEPLTLFKAFRGRAPSVDALLKQSGII